MFSHFFHPVFSSHLKITVRGFLSRFLRRHFVVIRFTMADSSYQLLNSSYQNLLLVLFRGGFLLKIDLVIPYHTQTNLLREKYCGVLKPPRRCKGRVDPEW